MHQTSGVTSSFLAPSVATEQDISHLSQWSQIRGPVHPSPRGEKRLGAFLHVSTSNAYEVSPVTMESEQRSKGRKAPVPQNLRRISGRRRILATSVSRSGD